MNGHGCIKFLLAVLVLAVIYFGWVITGALDRVRESNQRVLERLEHLEQQLQNQVFSPAALRPGETGTAPAPPAAGSNIANRQYFDPAAVPGGRLLQATMADTPNLNPLINNEATASEFYGLCVPALAELDYADPTEYQPMLAESWEISPDHRSYRIKLRRGVFWDPFTDPETGKKHGPKEVTAADFQFFIEVVKNPDVNCEAIRTYYQDLESIEIVNDFEFIVRWKVEYYGSRSSTLGMSPMPRHFYHAYDGPFDGKRFNNDHRRNRMLIGCGPYRFVRWEKDRRVIFRRNPSFFGNALGVGASLEYLVYEIIKHPNTRFQALLSGSLDRLGLTPDQWIQRTGGREFASGELKKYRYLLPQYTYIGYNLTNPCFQDKRVRQALTMLIDREKILRDIYFNLAKITTGPFFPEGPYADPSIRPWPYDPEQAKRQLAEAGWRDTDGDGILEKDGVKFVFTMLQIAASPIQQKMLPLIKESMAAAGIDMKIENVEWSVYLQRLNQRRFDASCLGWSSPFEPDMYQIWHSSQADRKESSNYIGFRNAEADTLIEEMRRTFDRKRRIEIAHAFARLLHDEQPYTFLFVPYSLVAQSGRYRNVHVFPVGMPERPYWVPKNEQRAVPGL